MGSDEFRPEYYNHDYFETGVKSNYRGYNPSGIFGIIIKIIEPIFRAESVLDIGCASGWMQRLYDTPLSFGIDLSFYNMKKRVTNNIICASASHLPFKRNTFDLIISLETLEHLTEEQQIQSFQEIDRVGKKWLYFSSCGLGGSVSVGGEASHIGCRDENSWIKLGESFGWEFDKPKVNYVNRSRIAIQFKWDIYIFKVKP